MSVCPFLGLEDDPSVMLSEPSALHRCYGAKPHRSPALGFQTANCLSENHVTCPVYKMAGLQVAKERAANAPTTKRKPVSRLPLVAGTLLALSALIVAALHVSGVYRLPIPTEAQIIPTQVALLVSAGAPAIPDGDAGSSETNAAREGASTETEAPKTPVPTVTSDQAIVQIASAGGAVQDAAPTPVAASPDAPVDTETPTPTDSPEPTATPSPTWTSPATATESEATVANETPIPAAAPPTATLAPLVLTPIAGEVGWVDSSTNIPAWGDSFLYAGRLGDMSLISGMLFDLNRIARGAPILSGTLELTGLNESRLDPANDSLWRVQLIAQNDLSDLQDANFMMLYSAPASITTLQDLAPTDLARGKVNSWELDSFQLGWLNQQVLNGATSVIARIVSVPNGEGDSVFAWDSGYGDQSNGNPPVLRLVVGPAPATPPPLPTVEYLVATFTPVPQNVLTVVAQQGTATMVATTVGTYTPVPPFITPTPPASNLATLQVRAELLEMPAIAVITPTPASAAEATANAEYATAVALTTGTYTPVPEDFVTPFVVLPSPPAENLATEVARLAEATAAAAELRETPTPAPYNMLVGEWITATPTPENAATVAALAAEATRDFELYGQPTETPFHWLVITPTSTPLPTSTPTIPPVILESEFTPTPVPTATEFIPNALPAEYRGLIFFKRAENGTSADWLVNPATGETGRVTREWIYPMARSSLTLSPDGSQEVFVRTSNEGVPELFIRTVGSNRETKLTNFPKPSYDPAWSPDGKWIAFVSSNSGNDEIYRVTPDGSILEQLTHNNWEWDKHPSWSPDSSKIVFFSNRAVGRTQIWVMNADGSSQQQLVTSDSEDMYPVWAR